MSEDTTNLEKAERWYGGFDIMQYILLLLLAIYISVWYLVIKGRWRNFYLSTFYALTCITAVAKITEIVIKTTKGVEDPKSVWSYMVLDRIAVMSKVIIELFQIAQMVELAIWVKVSAFKMRPEAAKRKIWWVRVCLAGTATFYFGVNLFDTFNLHYGITNNTVAQWRLIVNSTVLPVDYFSISIGLVISATYLLVNMHKYFEKKLRDDARRIKVIFLVLTVSYASRGVVYIMLTEDVITH